MKYLVGGKMRSSFICVVICTSFINLSGIDIRENDSYNHSVCLCDVGRHLNGSAILISEGLHINSSSVLVLSCQHVNCCYTYDYFGDSAFFLRTSCGRTLPIPLYCSLYDLAIHQWKNECVDAYYKVNALSVNCANLSHKVFIAKRSDSQYNIACEVCEQYLTFSEKDVELPIDISVLLANNVDTSFAKIYELPTNDQITSWKNKSVKVTIYGYPASKGSEYSVTCDMRLTDCGNWFKSLEPIPQCFLDLHGMSGGPGFTDEEVLCGVMSGCDNDRHLCVRALTTDLVEAIKFGVEKMLDK